MNPLHGVLQGPWRSRLSVRQRRRWCVRSFVLVEPDDLDWRPRVIETGSIVRHGVLAFREVMKRPKKSLHPLVLSIHALLLAARSLCSVNPTVRQSRGLSEAALSGGTESASPAGGVEKFFMCASAKEGRRQ
jgi:hypothetical protein